MDAVYEWALSNGASAKGWHLVTQWRRRGAKEAVLEVFPGQRVPVPSAVERLLHEWADSGALRLPDRSAPGNVRVVPCKYRCSRKAPDQVLVAFRGLPDRYALKGTPAAILRGVGYAKGCKISDVFFGVDPKRPVLSDGSVCAIVTPPPGDRQLARLPPSLYLGGCPDNHVTVYVSTRAAGARPWQGPPAAHGPPPPPPAGPRPTTWAEAARGTGAQGPAWAAAPAAAAPAAAPAAAAQAPPRALHVRVPGRGAASPAGSGMDLDSPPLGAAGAGAMAVDGPGLSGPGPRRQAALGNVSPQRAAAAWARLVDWTTTEFPSAAAAPGGVDGLLDEFLGIPSCAVPVARWAAEPGDLHQELLPAEVRRALTTWVKDVRGHQRQAAYAAGSPASSSEGGTGQQQRPAPGPPSRGPAGPQQPERSRSPGGARPERGRSPAATAAGPRRSARASLGRPPGPDSLARGAPVPMDVASSDGGSPGRPRRPPGRGGGKRRHR